MAFELHFSVFGDDQLDRTIARFEEAPSDMRPAWRELRRRFLAIERRQFATEGAYGSGGWRPLSPAYASWKAVHYPGKTILRRTDDLWRSLTVGPEVAILEPHFMVLGSAVPYGVFHQQGDGLPRRRPVELPEHERREWAKVIQSVIVTGRVTGVRAP